VPPDTLHPYGRVRYTHGLVLDHPLGITRFDHKNFSPSPVLIVPHRSVVAGYDVGTYSDGSPANKFCDATPPCALIVDWPGQHATVWGHVRTRVQPRSWIGSLIESSTDGSGMQTCGTGTTIRCMGGSRRKTRLGWLGGSTCTVSRRVTRLISQIRLGCLHGSR